MSLLEESMEDFKILNKTTEDDGYGGYNVTWVEGATIQCAVTFDTSIEARVGEQQGVRSLYTITTRKDITLEYHDVLKRVRDNKVFRITSDGDDKYTPNSAMLNMVQVTAEEWDFG